MCAIVQTNKHHMWPNTCSNTCITASPLLRPQMASPRGGRNKGILLYMTSYRLDE